jgi:hypothetical protein
MFEYSPKVPFSVPYISFYQAVSLSYHKKENQVILTESFSFQKGWDFSPRARIPFGARLR